MEREFVTYEIALSLKARPMMKYLCENHDPMVTVIITPTGAQLLGGLKGTGYIDEYIDSPQGKVCGEIRGDVKVDGGK